MRIDWIDIWKGLLILLVVAGHVCGMVAHYVSPAVKPIFEQGFKFIYSFHMPAFFMLAGVLYKDGCTFKAFVAKKATALLVPYFVFGVASIALYYLFMGSFHADASVSLVDSHYSGYQVMHWWHPIVSLLYGAPFPGTDGFRCNSVLWFLPCYFSAQIIFWCMMCIPMIGRILPWLMLALSSVLGFYLFDMPSFPLGLNVVFWYLQFFIIGYLAKLFIKSLLQNCREIKTSAVAFAVAVSLALWVLAVMSVNNILYSRFKFSGYVLVVLSGILGCFSSAGLSIMVMRLVPHGAFRKWMTMLGSMSLVVMLIHKYFILGFVLKLPFVRYLLVEGCYTAIGVSLFIILISAMLSLVVANAVVGWFPWSIGRFKK